MAEKSVAQAARGHKGAKSDLTADYVRSILEYAPKTGMLHWKIQGKGRPNKIGGVAGSLTSTGHIRVGLCGRLYLAHRLVWLIAEGMWPPHEIDHINRDGADNRLVNLRLATTAENQRNRPATKANKTGYKGVSFHKKTQKFAARITSKQHGGIRHLGLFTSPEEAHAAYCKAAQVLHGEFIRLK